MVPANEDAQSPALEDQRQRRPWRHHLLGAYAVCSTLFAISVVVRGPFDAAVVGSMADWVAGVGAAGAVLMAVAQITETRRVNSQERRTALVVDVLLRAYQSLLDAASAPEEVVPQHVQLSMNLARIAASEPLVTFIDATTPTALAGDASAFAKYAELLVSDIAAIADAPLKASKIDRFDRRTTIGIWKAADPHAR